MFKNKNFIKLLIIVILSVSLLFAVGCKKSKKSNNGEPSYVLSHMEITLQVGQSQQIDVLRTDNKTVTETVVWEIRNGDTASVENGLVLGKTPGTTYLDVIIGNDEIQLSCVIKVVNPMQPEPVLSLENIAKLDGTYTLTLYKGSTYTLIPALRLDGEVVETAEFIVSTSATELSISGTTISADQACENVEVVVSCEYGEQELSLTVCVSVYDLGGVE